MAGKIFLEFKTSELEIRSEPCYVGAGELFEQRKVGYAVDIASQAPIIGNGSCLREGDVGVSMHLAERETVYVYLSERGVMVNREIGE